MKRVAIIFCLILTFSGSATAQEWTDTCNHLRHWVGQSAIDEYTASLKYDTVKQYIEHCALSDPNSWDAFGQLDGAVQAMSSDTARYTSYRMWLISVLPLNRVQPEYFCACLHSIAYTFQVGKYGQVGYLAVRSYTRQYHPECWSPLADKSYSSDSANIARQGYDAVNLPPLDSLGLGFLLTKDVKTPANAISSGFLASFTGSPNPFTKETELTHMLNRMTFVTVAIYDELGRMVWGDGKGRSLDAGTHTIHIDGADFPSGTLYARISTGFGEVKTVKLVHQEK